MSAKPLQQSKKKLTTWTIPLTYVSTTFILGMLFPRMEHYLLPHLVSTNELVLIGNRFAPVRTERCMGAAELVFGLTRHDATVAELGPDCKGVP